MDLLIPALIMSGFVAVIVYSTIKNPRRKRRKEAPKEPPKYAHEPMDLRLKDDPCETKEN